VYLLQRLLISNAPPPRSPLIAGTQPQLQTMHGVFGPVYGGGSPLRAPPTVIVLSPQMASTHNPQMASTHPSLAHTSASTHAEQLQTGAASTIRVTETSTPSATTTVSILISRF